MSQRQLLNKSVSITLGLVLGLFVLSIIWINFHPLLWYRMDVYSTSYIARLMAEEKSFFPSTWMFGNQFYVFATPNVAALLYHLCHDSVLAMSLASSIMTILVIVSFFWCFYPFLSRQECLAGLVCLTGGIIFGSSAANYISGLQVLYTMCSYYACYIICIFLSIGCWFRFKKHTPVSPIILCLSILLNFAMGMQSLREILILAIPLLVMELFLVVYPPRPLRLSIRTILKNHGMIWVVVLLIVECFGYLIISALDIPSAPIIGDFAVEFRPNELFSNLWASTKNILRISGIGIVVDGKEFLPLTLCAVIIALNVLHAIIKIIKENDDSVLSQSIIFSLISVLCVYGVGIFFMRTRDIYYFVYWLLASLCVVYTLSKHTQSSHSPFIKFSILLIICLINYGYSFIPDIKAQRNYSEQLESFSENLVKKDIQMIYCLTSPLIAAASNDHILAQSIWWSPEMENGYPFTFSLGDKDLSLFDDAHYEGGLLCIPEPCDLYFSSASQAFQDSVLPHLIYYDELHLGNKGFYLYKTDRRLIEPLRDEDIQSLINR